MTCIYEQCSTEVKPGAPARRKAVRGACRTGSARPAEVTAMRPFSPRRFAGLAFPSRLVPALCTPAPVAGQRAAPNSSPRPVSQCEAGPNFIARRAFRLRNDGRCRGRGQDPEDSRRKSGDGVLNGGLQCTKGEKFVSTTASASRPGARDGSGSATTPASGDPWISRAVHAATSWFAGIQTFVAGVLIGVSLWTPVFVATAADETEWQQFGLPGGLALFGAGVWLRTGRPGARARRAASRSPAGPARPNVNRQAV